MNYYYIDKQVVSSEDVLEERAITYEQALKLKIDPLVDNLDRHRNQKEYGQPTTLTDDEAQAVADELQALRQTSSGSIF